MTARIILVAGLPGSGKSFFAERLASSLGANYLSSDQIRQEMHASGHYSLDDKLVVYREMLRRAETITTSDHDVVVDATFYYHTMREMFVTLAKDRDLRLTVIEVTAGEKLIRERLRKPRKFSEADFKVYETVRDEFEEITMPHLILESKAGNIDQMLAEARNYLEAD